MKKIIVALVIAVLLVSSVPAFVSAASPNNPVPVSDFSSEQILVKFQPNVSLPEAAETHRQLGGQVKETIAGIGVQVVTVPKGQAMEKAKAYSSNAKVAYAEPDFVAQVMGSPDDPEFANQWGMVKVQAPQAWEVTTGSPSIDIAILDTGVDLDHPDLASKIISNVNFSGSTTVDDVYGHGTHVAGIAAAMTNNGIGVVGLGYHASLMNVKVLGDTGSGTYSAIASGIIWAADNGAEVINMSLGGYAASSTLEDAINYAWSKGVVVVAAAGNSGSTTLSYPAYYTNCIAVAATDARDAVASFSTYGKWVDVAAPGLSIYSTLIDNGYGYKSGTSMASPHVAGLAALVFTTVSDANGDGRLNDEVRGRIEATCDDIGVSVSRICHGRINAAQAVGNVPVLSGSITGSVTDATDGSPIVGAAVTDGTRTTTTDASGTYTIADVPTGSYEVTASKEGYESTTGGVTVTPGTAVVIDFSLGPQSPRLPDTNTMWVDSIRFIRNGKNLVIEVNVVSDNSALPGAAVGLRLECTNSKVWSFSGITDSAGLVKFRAGKMPVGSYLAIVNSLACSGFTWDTTRGITAASYALSG
jgi:thermitase